MRRSPALALVALVSLSACEDLAPDIDPFPIPANRTHGPLRVGLVAGIDAPVVALLDTNTPLSVIDRETDEPRRRRTDVAIMSACGGENPLAGCTNVKRARYEAAAVIETHPCGVAGAACRIGLEPLDGLTCSATAGPETVGYGAILGADLLSMSALRVDLRNDDAPVVRLFPDIAGEREFYCETGVAVLTTPMAGGATIAIEGGEVIYAANRIPLNACADYDIVADDQPSGADLLLLLSTGIGPTVISEAAYTRYFQRINDFCLRAPARCGAEADQLSVPPFYSELPAQCLHLPAGPTVARIATIRRIGITGHSARARGPCEERRAARIMTTEGACAEGVSCPCENNTRKCEADAAVDLEPPEGITVAVLPDAHPLLQGLREELRPGLAEVDGLLGLDAMHALTLDIDYPAARVLVECDEAADATARPACTAYTEVSNSAGTTPADRCR